MNMFKKNGGFTLVELIVVIAILAILAGVAIPLYSGYISRANDAACLSELTAIQTAAQAACSLEGVDLEEIEIAADGTITVTPDSDVVDAEDVEDDFEALYTAPANLTTLLAKHSNYTANASVVWTEGEWDLLADADDNGQENNTPEDGNEEQEPEGE